MLSNINPIADLASLARAKARAFETKTVGLAAAEQMLAEGWEIDKKNKKSIRLRKAKPHDVLLEDSLSSQIDVIAIDDEVALAVECKSAEKSVKRAQFQQELGKHALIRERFTASVRSQFSVNHKRQTVLAMCLGNSILSDNDKARAKDANIIVFDEYDLTYYESLASHIGPAAKYQLLAEMLPGKTVPGLAIRLPAIRSKMG